jgi:hypothetical protein
MVVSTHCAYATLTDETLLASDFVPEPNAAEEIIYKVASNRGEREEAFRLVYRAYTQSGLIGPNPFEMRVLPHHVLPTTQVFVAKYQGRVICTVSLVGDGEMGIPMQCIFGDELRELRQRGIRFAEVSSLADRREFTSQFARIMPVLIKLSRVMAQSARRSGIDQLLVACHPRHARFYKRFMGYSEFGTLRSYPSVQNRPAVALALDFAAVDRDRPTCYDQIFGMPLPPEDLRPHPMPPEDRDYFRPAAELAGYDLPLACD